MATKKLGNLIKQARTDAGLTQEALAKKVDDCSASDISKAERAEKDLTQEQLKQIAKACGVTQKSLLEAAGSSAKKTTSSSSKKTTSSSSSKKTASSSSSKKTTTSSSSKKTTSPSSTKKSTSSTSSVKVTATEKKFLELYRAADSDTKKAATALLKGESPSQKDILTNLLESASDEDSLLGGLLGNIMKKS